jgi:hypothetical protein
MESPYGPPPVVSDYIEQVRLPPLDNFGPVYRQLHKSETRPTPQELLELEALNDAVAELLAAGRGKDAVG